MGVPFITHNFLKKNVFQIFLKVYWVLSLYFWPGLKACGVKKGDRVVGYIPNCPEAIEAMAATAAIG